MSTVPAQITLPGGGPTFLAVGVDHNCMIARDGTVWCWGLNDHGQLGDGTTTSRSTPVQVMGLPSVNGISVSPSGGFSCVSSISSSAYCWGRNDRGQLGDGTTTDRSVPVPVIGTNDLIAQVGAGQDHACGFGASATNFNLVMCWGANDHGQVGDGTTTERHTPVQLTFTTAAPAVPSTGRVQTVALAFLLVAAALTVSAARRRKSP
jgi:alpha-tubulin suppressor-like RCC1 family protein